VSVSNNIAEGSGGSDKEFAKYLDIMKSALETVSSIHLAKELNYISANEQQQLYNEAELLIKRVRAFKNALSVS